MVGFCIVDMHRWYRNVKARELAKFGPSYKQSRNCLQDIFAVENEYEHSDKEVLRHALQ